MGYFELLPRIDDICKELTEADFSAQQRETLLAMFGNYLNEWSEYHLNEFQRVGEKQDRGAYEALDQMAQDFLSASRYSTSTD